MAGMEVYVIGGGNSAGQDALHLARYARHVTLLVRGASLAASMSEYLIAQLDATRNVGIRYGTAVLDGREEDGCLAALTLGDQHSGPSGGEEVPAGGLFVLIGSVPRTQWLPAEIVRDHFRLTIQPFDGPADPDQVERVIEHLRSDAMLLYASDYPHWQFDGDAAVPEGFPDATMHKMLVDNALATYSRLSPSLATHEEAAP